VCLCVCVLGATPLHMAALTGEGDVCSLLVREGADVELRTPKVP